MTKSEKEADLKQRISKQQIDLYNLETELSALKDMREMTLKEIFDGYEAREGFTSSKESGSFQYILGGDDRSAPWDETRTGKVLKVTTPANLYIPHNEMGKFAVYLKMTDGSDVQAIFINGKQQIG
jgi:hypothetical protein